VSGPSGLMLTIYTSPESLYCAKLRVLLRHKNLHWQEVEPQGGCGSAGYRDLIPSATMPAMVDGDLVIADSEAIAEYLNETVAEPPMLPLEPGARARCRERSRFHDTRLEPELRKLFPHISPANRNPEVVATQALTIALRLQELSAVLKADNYFDPRFLSLGDCGLPISFAWIDAFAPVLALELDWPENLLDYRSAIEKQPAVAAELREYAPAVRRWMESKDV
jgi:glutathione S-transferase